MRKLTLVTAFAIGITGAALLPTTNVDAAPLTCGGFPVTIVPANPDKANTINGTKNRDVIWAGAGGDTIKGKGGDDVICAGEGDDRIFPGDGADTIYGDGNSNVSGGARWLGDWVDYSAKNNGITVNLGTGQAATGGGLDKLYGIENVQAGSGNDTITGNGGTNRLDGGRGSDTINGGGGIDRMWGGPDTGDHCWGVQVNPALRPGQCID
jgi:Ca2+-binding RTX toxin-like protein